MGRGWEAAVDLWNLPWLCPNITTHSLSLRSESCPETCPHGLTQWEVVQPSRHSHRILQRPLIIQDFLCYTPRIPGCYGSRQGGINCRARKVRTYPGVETRSLHLNANSPEPALCNTRTTGNTGCLKYGEYNCRTECEILITFIYF